MKFEKSDIKAAILCSMIVVFHFANITVSEWLAEHDHSDTKPADSFSTLDALDPFKPKMDTMNTSKRWFRSWCPLIEKKPSKYGLSK